MITFLRGRLAHALPTQATIDVGGVGYEVFIPLSSYDKLPGVGQPIEILTHLHVREDAQILYGFMSAPERDLFRLLVNHVSGIGPKLALAVLSGMSVNNFKAAVVNNDVVSLSKISGVGKKTAERMVLELKDRVGVGGLGSGERGACPDARAGAGERSGSGVDRARLQADRRPQAGARFTGTRRRRKIGGGIGETGAEEICNGTVVLAICHSH